MSEEDENLTSLLSGIIFPETNVLVGEFSDLPLTEFTFKVDSDTENTIKSEVSLVVNCLGSRLEDKFAVFTDTVLGVKSHNGFTLTKTRYNNLILRATYVVFDYPEDYLDYLEKKGKIVIGGVR